VRAVRAGHTVLAAVLDPSGESIVCDVDPIGYLVAASIIATLGIAGKVSQIAKIGYKDLKENKSVRNNAMIEASTRRIMIAFNKIEEFKQNKKYEDSLNLLCGYLLFDVLRMQENMSEEIEILDLIKSRKNYFDSDTFINKTMISMSPIMFANHLNRKDRR